MIRIIAIAFIVAMALFGGDAKVKENQKHLSLSDYLSETKGKWLLTEKKEYTVRAMMVSKDMTFHNNLEDVDYLVRDDGETVVLKGSRDEMWTCPLSKVIVRYRKPDASELCKEDFAHKDTFIDIVTIPDGVTYYAIHVPKDIVLSVETAQGDLLHTNLPATPHGKGDYLICMKGKDGGPNLSDVWVLNGLIFADCYDISDVSDGHSPC